MLWRWHFYAGLFCIPFVIVLSITGAIYLFKPQIEALIDRPYDHLEISGARASAHAQVDAALAAVPRSTLQAYELPQSEAAAVRVLVRQGDDVVRVYLHPQTLATLKIVREEARFMRVVRTIHGELLIGDTGSILVELAASWAIVMLLTGLYLWWPRSQAGQGVGGILYPRLRLGTRIFWRDLHAVTGFWISVLALFLLLTGLPWAKVWGSYFKAARQLADGAVQQQDWSVGREPVAAVSPEHAHHDHRAPLPSAVNFAQLDRVAASARALQLAPPVLIAPVSGGATWQVKSDAQNRPLRADLTLDGETGAILQRRNFSERPLLDRVVGTGVAAHEGQLFGWFNQLLGVLTALGLLLLCVSSLILWWRRRAHGLLGAPAALAQMRIGRGVVVATVLLAFYLPLFGASLLAVALLERWVLRRIPAAARWLGLREAAL